MSGDCAGLEFRGGAGLEQASGECPCEAGSQPHKTKRPPRERADRLEKGEVARTEPGADPG